MKRLEIVVLSLMVLGSCLSGLSGASVLPNCTPETGKLSIDVAITAGAGSTVTEDESLSLKPSVVRICVRFRRLMRMRLRSIRQHPHNEKLNAVNGVTIYSKSLDVDTASQDASGNNVDVTKTLDYAALAGGKAVLSENALMSDAGYSNIGEEMICPFGADTTATIGFCEAVQTSTNMEMQSVSATTQTGMRTIALSADTPAAMTYSVHAGDTTLDAGVTGAAGSITIGSTVSSHDSNAVGELANTLTASETTHVSGVFDITKSISYLSGVSSVPLAG